MTGRPSNPNQRESYLKLPVSKPIGVAKQMKHFSWLVLVAVLSIAGIGSLHADTAQSAGAPTEHSAKALALKWFLKLQAGKIDRAQYAPAYGALLTDDAVKSISHHLNEYGASPTSSEVLQSRSACTKMFY